MRLGPFARQRQERRDKKDLGTGLWRQTHDRFQRSLERYWQIVESDSLGGERITPEERNGLVHAGNMLTDLLPRVRAMCIHGRRASGADNGLNVPGKFSDMRRWISQASNDLATTAQAVALFRRGKTDIATVGRRAQKVIDAIDAAESTFQH